MNNATKLLLAILGLFALPFTALAEDDIDPSEDIIGPTATILIDASVEAAVYIDYIYAGVTPYTDEISTGAHNIRVSADGYQPYVRGVTLEKGERNKLYAELDRGEGSIEFQANVSGAEIVLSNNQKLILPIRLDPLPTGTYGYTVYMQNHEPQKGTFVFSPGKNLFIYTELESSSGVVDLKSTPHKAKTYIDTNYVGQTPVLLNEYEGGEYTIMMKRFGRAKVFRKMDTSLGNKGEIRATLPKDGARLIVRTRSKDAVVIIEGYTFGHGRWVRTGKLEEGIYDLEIDYDDRDPIITHIDIPNQGSVRYKSFLYKSDSENGDVLAYRPALYRRWALWGAIAGVSAGAGAGAYLYIQANQPDPLPDGDVVLSMP